MSDDLAGVRWERRCRGVAGALSKAIAELGERDARIAELSMVVEEHGATITELTGRIVELEAQHGAIVEWTHQMGRALCPRGADTYGEGMRDAKTQVGRILGNTEVNAELQLELDEARAKQNLDEAQCDEMTEEAGRLAEAYAELLDVCSTVQEVLIRQAGIGPTAAQLEQLLYEGMSRAAALLEKGGEDE